MNKDSEVAWIELKHYIYGTSLKYLAQCMLSRPDALLGFRVMSASSNGST